MRAHVLLCWHGIELYVRTCAGWARVWWMSASFLEAVACRHGDLLNCVHDATSFMSLPHALIDLILSKLVYRVLAAVSCTCRSFHTLHAPNAADIRSHCERLHVPARRSHSEPWLHRYYFAEILAAQLKETISAADEHSLLCVRSGSATSGSESDLLTWGTGLHLGHENAEIVLRPIALPCLDALDDALDEEGSLENAVARRAQAHPIWQSVSAGLAHSVAVSEEGEAWAWGYSNKGALGHGSIDIQVQLPRRISIGQRVAQAACAERHTLLLTVDGRVFSCGDGLGGRLGHGDASPQYRPRQLELWQRPPTASTPEGDAATAAVSTARTTDHCATQPTAPRAASSSSSLRARALAGSLDARSAYGAIGLLEVPPRITHISAGEAHSLAIDAWSGQAYAWGLYHNGRLGLRKASIEAAGFPGGSADVLLPMCVELPGHVAGRRACAGEAYSLVIDSHGGLHAWGRNAEGQLGLGDETPKTKWKPTQVSALAGVAVRQVAAARIHTLALSESGDVYSWGVDAGGRLGHGERGRPAEPLPRRIDCLSQSCTPRFWPSRVLEVAAGREHSLCLLEDGSVLAWGKQLGAAGGAPRLLEPFGIYGPSVEVERRQQPSLIVSDRGGMVRARA